MFSQVPKPASNRKIAGAGEQLAAFSAVKRWSRCCKVCSRLRTDATSSSWRLTRRCASAIVRCWQSAWRCFVTTLACACANALWGRSGRWRDRGAAVSWTTVAWAAASSAKRHWLRTCAVVNAACRCASRASAFHRCSVTASSRWASSSVRRSGRTQVRCSAAATIASTWVQETVLPGCSSTDNKSRPSMGLWRLTTAA